MLTADRNILSKFDDSKRALAKLMARENITVQIIAGVPTASFDVAARVLTLPDWPSLTVNQLDTQIGHEVGHSLFTNTSYLEELAKARAAKKHSGLMSFINVVEDARIERLMREAYPGLLETFYEGRKDFSTKGPIFQVVSATHILQEGKKKPVKDMMLIDRINLFYKIGAFIQIPFTAAEQPWIAEINRAWSTERAVEIAKALHELAKDEIEKQQQEQQQGPKAETDGAPQSGEQGEPGEQGDEGEQSETGDESSAGEKEDGDQQSSEAGDAGESKEQKESKDGKSQTKTGTGQKKSPVKPQTPKTSAEKAAREAMDPASETDKALEQALRRLAQEQPPSANQIRHLLLKPVDAATVNKRTMTASAWAEESMERLLTVNCSGLDKLLDRLETTWNNAYLATAENMASEFLRKKTAKNLQHARTGKTGRLDMTKLSRYKFAEDLFKRVSVVPNGQSHGIVMLIDGSSSMRDVFGAVLDQVLLFAHFAFKTNIPFECYLFTSEGRETLKSAGLQTITLPEYGRLVGLVNTVVNRSSFKKQIRTVLALRNNYTHDVESSVNTSLPYGSLGGSTPLYAGMMLMERHLERMKRTLRLDKVQAVVISDGEDNKHLYFETQTPDYNGHMVSDFEQLGTSAVVVRDTVTKKNHVLVEATAAGGTNYQMPNNGIMTLLFDVMKSRHGARSIYLYLTEGVNTSQRREYTPYLALPFLRRAGVTNAIHANDVKKSMDEYKQFVLPAADGVADCAMLMTPTALQLSENEFRKWNATGVSQEKVQKEFVRLMTKAVANRVFVNSVIPFLV